MRMILGSETLLLKRGAFNVRELTASFSVPQKRCIIISSSISSINIMRIIMFMICMSIINKGNNYYE